MKARLPEGYAPPKKNDLMRQYQQMQERIELLTAELKAKEYSATAGGGMVSATVSGEHRVLSLSVNPEIIDPSDSEMMCDMIAAAVNEAIATAAADYDRQMGAVTGGLSLPQGLV